MSTTQTVYASGATPDDSWTKDPKMLLNIEFSITASDGRTINFKDMVSIIGLRDWFDRAGRAVSTVFSPSGPTGLICTDGGPNKIQSIKKVRELANVGLREAKDFIEGNAKLVFKSSLDAADATGQLATFGCKLKPAVPDSDINLNVINV
jgi:hypothetical protein